MFLQAGLEFFEEDELEMAELIAGEFGEEDDEDDPDFVPGQPAAGQIETQKMVGRPVPVLTCATVVDSVTISTVYLRSSIYICGHRYLSYILATLVRSSAVSLVVGVRIP